MNNLIFQNDRKVIINKIIMSEKRYTKEDLDNAFFAGRQLQFDSFEKRWKDFKQWFKNYKKLNK